MKKRTRKAMYHFLLTAALLLFILVTGVMAEEELPTELREIGITEKLNSSVDLKLTFTDESGHTAPLRQFFVQGRPVLLNLVYFSCPMLCGMVSNGLTDTLRGLSWMPGRDVEVVTVSFDPKDNHKMAQAKKEFVLEKYGRADTARGWHFLVGQERAIRELTDQVGFRYRYDAAQQQFAHAAATIVLTSDGKISRYLYGIEHEPKNLRLALMEAGQGRYGSTVDRFLLFCFHYDAGARSYVLYATRFMQAGGLLIVIILGSALWLLWRREIARPRKPSPVMPSVSAHRG